jgi:predicted NAD-dependent protein-ADP-ribosyltransferase YbiA (DUF1768 family)
MFSNTAILLNFISKESPFAAAETACFSNFQPSALKICLQNSQFYTAD